MNPRAVGLQHGNAGSEKPLPRLELGRTRRTIQRPRGGHFSKLIPLSVVVLAIISVVASGAIADTTSFSGSVDRGQRYEHRISKLYDFVLTPTDTGWTVDVFTPAYPKISLTTYTPPIHCCPFEQGIEPYNFTLVPREGSNWLARPQRTVIFSIKVPHVLNPTPLDIDEIRKDGEALVTVTDVWLANINSEHIYIRRLTFKVNVTYNPHPRQI